MAELRLADVERGPAIRFTWNGTPVAAHDGETIAAALLAAGRRELRLTARGQEPRGFFCAMGVCFDCLVTVDGHPGVRACATLVRHGMEITS
jgi:predicted molibdopterin-dependent oxidoreductase YjgC